MQSSIERSLRAIEAIAELQPIGVGELARKLDVPKSTMQRTLQTLASAGWIKDDGGAYKRWKLTSRALKVGRQASADESDLRTVAFEHMQALRDATNETITLQVRDGQDRMVQIERVDSFHAVRTFWKLGASSPITATSGGFAVLAALPDHEVEAILKRPVERLTPKTITDVEEIRREIAAVRERGFAVNIGQNREGVCAIGAAIVDSSGEPVGGIGISIPESRFDPRRINELGALVRSTASTISSLM